MGELALPSAFVRHHYKFSVFLNIHKVSTEIKCFTNIFHIGMLEYFQGSCKGLTSWLDEQSDGSYSAFTEGWALYSENPIMSDDTDLYKDNPLQKYGMFKWQVSPFLNKNCCSTDTKFGFSCT